MRFFKAAIATLALVGALAQPASALDNHSYTNAQSSGANTITMHGFWQVQPNDDGTATIAFECYANGAPFATALGFRQCYLEGENGVKYHGRGGGDSNPGFVTADGDVVLGAKAQRHRICLQAAGQFPDGVEFFATTLACSTFR